MLTEQISVMPVETSSGRSVIHAGDYLNKLSGEKIEYECRRSLEAGATEIVVDFSETQLVNSIGISILLGLIDIATNNGAKVTFSKMNEHTVELFSMLGITNHVSFS